ncbi:MAG TPA: GDSL-type esterase/lipase family protein [Nocardioides sp.]|nr:GDSL-type esterase/lipase family protein [Nocardioides sp.]
MRWSWGGSLARRTARVVGAVGAVVLAAGLVVIGDGAASARTDEPVRPKVLVLGDSLSQGFGGDSTWRYWFWRETNRQGVPVDFVGPDAGFIAGYGTRYERPNLAFDRHHAARGGSTVNDHLAKVDALMTTYQPDVVVVELGVNDALRGDSGATIAAELEELMGHVWQQAPAAQVLLAEVPSHQARPEADAAGSEANALLAARFADDGRVFVAHNRTDAQRPWAPSVHTFDGLHPNAAGQTLLAQHLVDAYHRAGRLPQAPQVYQQRTWSPNVLPRLILSGRTLTVDWSRGMTEIKMSQVRIRIRKRTATTHRDTPWYPTGTRRITRTLTRGTYDVQLIPRRWSMIGAPGQRVTVQVR